MHGSFSCLKDQIAHESRGEGKLFLLRVFYLFSKRQKTVGLNQIWSVYNPHRNGAANDLIQSSEKQLICDSCYWLYPS